MDCSPCGLSLYSKYRLILITIFLIAKFYMIIRN